MKTKSSPNNYKTNRMVAQMEETMVLVSEAETPWTTDQMSDVQTHNKKNACLT